MRKGIKLGRLGASLDPKDFADLKESAQKPEKIYADSVKAGCEQELRALEEEKQHFIQEKKDRGNPLSSVIWSKIKQELFFAVLVIICLIGEFIFGEWFIGPFGLGEIRTALLAVTFMIVLIKGVDFFLSALEAKWPQHCSIFNLVFGGIGFVLVFALIFMASDIRGLMYEATSTLRSVTSAEDTVGVAKDFFKEASNPFLILMMVLTSAITLIGGITYHRVKERLFPLLQLRALDRRLKQLEQGIVKRRQAIAGQDAMMAEFLADIQLGYSEEKARRSRKSGLSQLASAFQFPSLGSKAAFVCFLILAILGCGFFLSGVARGEVLVFLDMTGSAEVRDYVGKETEFQKNVRGIEKSLEEMPMGESFKVVGITGKTFSSPYFLLEGKMAKNKGAFGEVIARDRLAAVNRWRKQNLKPVSDSTDIFGAVHLAAILFSDVSSKRKNLVIFSDMRQYGKGFDFETPSELQTEALLGQIRRKGMPSLHGVRVWCLGVHASGKTPLYWESLKRFWEQYFKLTDVSKLCAFSMERNLNFEEF